MVQGTEDGKGGEAFLEVEGDQKEEALTALLEDDQVREEMGHVARARLRPEPQNGRAEEGAMEGWSPGEGNALGPEPIKDVQDGDGALIQGAGPSRCFGNKGDVARAGVARGVIHPWIPP